MRIAHNIAAMQANLRLTQVDKKLTTSSARLSSGYKLLSSKDNPADMSISNKMQMQIKGIEKAGQNTLNGISLVQTAEGAMAEIQNITQRLRELAIQGATDTYTDADRGKIDIEAQNLADEITSIAQKSDFNGINLLDGTKMDKDLNYVDEENPIVMLQVGQNKNMTFKVQLEIVNRDALGLESITSGATDPLDYNTKENCQRAIEKTDEALKKISEIRAKFGAYENALDFSNSNLEGLGDNLITSLGRIRDTDMAKEMTNYTRDNIISQAAISVLGQANQRPQLILQLLK